MSEAADGAPPPRSAWQPFTFGGVAAFARAGVGRLLLAELVAALVVGMTVVWLLHGAYAPVILQAIQQMPDTAKMADGRLIGVDTKLIAESKFLAIAVTPEVSAGIGQGADIQVQFRRTNFRIDSILRPDWGLEYNYAPGVTADLGRSILEPWWGAWHPVFFVSAGVAVIVLLFGIWALLAVFYTVPAKFIAWYADRELSWGGAWRLGSAAHLPGALLMVMATFLYGWRAMDLVGLIFFFVAHLLVDWVYVAGGAWACPRLPASAFKQNPFIS